MINKKTNTTELNLAYKKLVNPENYFSDDNYTINKAFAISNEELEQVFKSLNLKNKKVLTVGSSGDQALNAILKGSTDITIIDANVFSRPFIEYKIAAIKTFNFETFSDIFIKSNFFSKNIYSQISDKLSENVKLFWDNLILETNTDNNHHKFSPNLIKDKMLIVDHRDRHSSFYKNEFMYNKLQTLLNGKDLNISFINAELQEFPSILEDKYDLIYLSNIYDYYKNPDNNIFEEILHKLYQNNLNDNGTILANYSFNKPSEISPKQIGGYKIKHLPINRFHDGENCIDTACLIEKPDIDEIENSK